MSRALLYCAGGGIGDSLVATVVAQALHHRFDSVDALTLPGHRATLERVPDLDNVEVDSDSSVGELATLLRGRSYDACIVSWATARAAEVVCGAEIPIRVGQANRLYSSKFTHRVAVRSERGNVTAHWSDILLDYARAIDCDAVGAHPNLSPTAQDDRSAEELRRELSIARAEYLLLHPTNAIASERAVWPTMGWARIASALRRRFSMPVLLSGSAAEDRINARIVEEAGDDGVISIAGRTGIGAFAALARDARAFVGITTGSMHVAAAVEARTVGIFPFQSDFPERWAPLCRRRAIVRASYRCHRGDRKESCSDYACIAELDAVRVVAALEGLLSQ